MSVRHSLVLTQSFPEKAIKSLGDCFISTYKHSDLPNEQVAKGKACQNPMCYSMWRCYLPLRYYTSQCCWRQHFFIFRAVSDLRQEDTSWDWMVCRYNTPLDIIATSARNVVETYYPFDFFSSEVRNVEVVDNFTSKCTLQMALWSMTSWFLRFL